MSAEVDDRLDALVRAFGRLAPRRLHPVTPRTTVIASAEKRSTR